MSAYWRYQVLNMQEGKILVAENRGVYVLKFIGDVRLTLCTTIDSLLKRIFGGGDLKSVVIDLTETEGIDSTALGLLAKIAVNAKEAMSRKPMIVSTRDDITRVLDSMGFDHYFNLRYQPIALDYSLEEAPVPDDECADSIRQKVIDAHRILMGLNPRNKEEFEPVVFALENCKVTPDFKSFH
ncbi:anti-anti-sigma factor [Oceanospirillum linum]|nr:anti-anti-sigma factor [Oleiphilus messinensis]SMP30897.1 anti-anti-sigma factor [Oceanospirillum linum]